KKQDEEKQDKLISKFTGKTIPLTLKDGKAKVETAFEETDPRFRNNFHYKVFTVKLEKGKIYRIDHRGAAGDPKFDPYLVLEDETGKQVDVDDDSGGGLDSRIVYKVGKSGTYRIVATTFVPKQTGKFVLEIRPPEKNEATTAELMFRANDFAALKNPERKELA